VNDGLGDCSEKPKGEARFLPPGEPRRFSTRIWVFTDENGFKVVKLGPLGALALALLIGLTLFLGVVFLTSAVLALVPICAGLALAAYCSGGRWRLLVRRSRPDKRDEIL
jgi:hypothetical protein